MPAVRRLLMFVCIFAMSISVSAEINNHNKSIVSKTERTKIPADTSIKVMSFNIRYDSLKGMPSSTDPNAWNYVLGVNRRDRVINMIMSESKAFGSDGPDILGVQETIQNQADDLQNAMAGYGLSGVCGKTGCDACRIFYRSNRFTKLDSGTFWLSETPDVPGSVCSGAKYPRIASWVILKDLKSQKNCFVLSTHWDFSQEPKCYSAQLIRDKINEVSGGLPAIMMGDLNTLENEQAYSILVGSTEPNGLQLTDTHRSVHPKIGDDEATFHGWRGGKSGNRIDYIFHNGGFYTARTTIERDEVLNNYPSDHYPVTAIIHYNEQLTISAD